MTHSELTAGNPANLWSRRATAVPPASLSAAASEPVPEPAREVPPCSSATTPTGSIWSPFDDSADPAPSAASPWPPSWQEVAFDVAIPDPPVVARSWPSIASAAAARAPAPGKEWSVAVTRWVASRALLPGLLWGSGALALVLTLLMVRSCVQPLRYPSEPSLGEPALAQPASPPDPGGRAGQLHPGAR